MSDLAANESSPLVRLWRYAARHRGRILVASLFSVLNQIMDIAPELLIGGAVDVVVRRERSWLAGFGVVAVEDQLVVLAILTFAVWVLESAFEYAYGLVWRNLAQTVQHELRVETYDHVQGLDLAYFEDRSVGGLMSIVNDDVNQLERFLDGGANELIQTVTSVLGVAIIFFLLSTQIALLAVIPIPLIIWGSIRFTQRMTPRYAAVREQAGNLSAQLSNTLGGIATIKAFNAEARETRRLAEESDRYRRLNQWAIRLSAGFIPGIRIFILAGFLATLLYGGFRTLDGTLEVAAFSVLVFLTQRLLWPLTRLGATLDLYQRAMASTSRILDLLDTQSEIANGHLPLPDPQGAVTFERVSFAYKTGPPVLAEVDIDIPAGQTVAVVGATGAGKTTLIKLLLRYADVTGGRVTVDGLDVREVDIGDLRGAIGLVSQDVFLFHGTVRDNIAYGRQDASLDEVEAASRAAEAHDFILELAAGYDTMVGERGQKLSGGQRQRISIARAILARPAILILDEATSAVDNETEAAIQRSLQRVAHQRTMLVIAHRLSTIRHADRIFVLDRGRVVEQGKHDDLVAAGGVYSALWKVQTGEVEFTPASDLDKGLPA
jgi:ATP-binding cassette, subfamily B, bacterial